ncbi:hypothetical protein AB4254_08540 [Vibrio breoganii]
MVKSILIIVGTEKLSKNNALVRRKIAEKAELACLLNHVGKTNTVDNLSLHSIEVLGDFLIAEYSFSVVAEGILQRRYSPRKAVLSRSEMEGCECSGIVLANAL